MAPFAPRFTPAFSANIPQELATHLRQLYLAIGDHNDAIQVVNDKIGSSTSGTNTTVNRGSSGGSNPVLTGIGAVNNQTGVTAYTVQRIDNAALIRLGDASPVAITLDSSLVLPFFTTLSNEGPGMVTATPSTGTVNGFASIAIPAGSWTTIYLDGTNWEADSPGASTGGLTVTITTAALTGLGSQGSQTFVNGILTAQVQAT